jgi:hypothetical protein
MLLCYLAAHHNYPVNTNIHSPRKREAPGTPQKIPPGNRAKSDSCGGLLTGSSYSFVDSSWRAVPIAAQFKQLILFVVKAETPNDAGLRQDSGDC